MLTRAVTSACIGQLSAAQEAQVPGPRPDGLCIAEAEFRVEVVGVQRLLPVDRVVTRGIVRTAHPNLANGARTSREALLFNAISKSVQMFC